MEGRKMMIQSILDNDLYKFSVSYAYMKLYPESEGTFTFNDRDDTEYDEEFLKELNMEFTRLATLQLTHEEQEWTSEKIPYIPKVYWEWLSSFRYDYSLIEAYLDEDRHLHIEVTDRLYRVTLYEVPILAIVSELRNKYLGNVVDDLNRQLYEPLLKKLNTANENCLKFSEFGTRRRFSYAIHEKVVECISINCLSTCVGTSNVYLARKYNMTPCGTFPHEWVMFHGASWGYQEANILSMRDWVRTYDGSLGIFLMDTYTSKVGLSNMSLKYAKLFDGVRQDSGDEIEIGNMVIERYKKLGIDPTTKTIVFSNALDFDKYLKIARYFVGKIKVSAGIGTNLTNDVGFKPSNIVMKLSKCRLNPNQAWRKCIKISDDFGKHMGDDKEFEVAKYLLKIGGNDIWK